MTVETMTEIENSNARLVRTVLEVRETLHQYDPVEFQFGLYCALVEWRNANRGKLPPIDWQDYDDAEPCLTIAMAESLVCAFLNHFEQQTAKTAA